MDLVLIFYYTLLIGIIVSPFLYVKQRLKKGLDNNSIQEIDQLKIKRLILLDNLRDLRTETDMQKLTPAEFQELSSEIVNNLQEVDREISERKQSFEKTNPIEFTHNETKCMECNYEVKIMGAKFCPMCGRELG